MPETGKRQEGQVRGEGRTALAMACGAVGWAGAVSLHFQWWEGLTEKVLKVR